MSNIGSIKCYYLSEGEINVFNGLRKKEAIMMNKDKYSIFSVLEQQQMFDKEAIEWADRIKQEISDIVDASSLEDKERAKAVFARKVAFKLTEPVYRKK